MSINDFYLTASLLIETIMVLLWTRILFQSNRKSNKYTYGIIVVNVCTYLLVNLRILPETSTFFSYVILFWYCKCFYRRKFFATAICLIISLAICSWIEVIMTFFLDNLVGSKQLRIILFISSMMGLLLTLVIKRYLSGYEFRKEMMIEKKDKIVLFGLSVLIISLLLDYHFNDGSINIYIIIIWCVLMLLFYYWNNLCWAKYQIEEKKQEIHLQQIYGKSYEQLLRDMRKKQHNYKNQLGVIYNTHLIASSMEELIKMQREYGNSIQTSGKFDSILLNCNNSVLASFLYYKFDMIENEGIGIEYSIHVDQAESCLSLPDIVDILGILLDNAFEYVKDFKSEKSCIKFNFYEDENGLGLTVSNPSHYRTNADIEQMFLEGYSTKGNNRGMGLAKIKDLSEKHLVVIHVFNTTDDQINWINFKIKIGKRITT